MKLQVHREPSMDEGTFGKALLIDDEDQIIERFEYLTLPWRDNQEGISSIPAGVYKADLYDSPHFRRQVYLLDEVPGRMNIEIHPLNWAGDTTLGWHSDALGCMGVGRGRAEMTPPDTGRSQKAITSSTAALDELIGLAGTPLTVEIIGDT